MTHEALHCHVGVQIDDDYAAQALARILHEERNVQNDHCIGIALRVDSPQHLAAYGRVDDCIQIGECLTVPEYLLGKTRPVEMTAVGENLTTESLDHSTQDLFAGTLEIPNDLVGIDDHGAMGGEL